VPFSKALVLRHVFELPPVIKLVRLLTLVTPFVLLLSIGTGGGGVVSVFFLHEFNKMAVIHISNTIAFIVNIFLIIDFAIFCTVSSSAFDTFLILVLLF
jgi:hypothetical protein